MMEAEHLLVNRQSENKGDSPILLRKGVPGEKKPLKEKLIAYYEILFKGEDPSRKNAHFWEEFFLLKVNVEYIIKTIEDLSQDELLKLKGILALLFSQCVHMLQIDDNNIRNINALQTLCALTYAILRKKFTESNFDIIDTLIGFESAECQMQNLVECINKFLSDEYPVSVKNLSLRLLLIFLTAMDSVNKNVMLEYIMMNSVFETLMQILSNPDSRELHGCDSTLILTVLVNYRKHEAANPYVIKLSVLDDELALNGLGCIISQVLTEYNRHYSPEEEAPGWFFSQLSSMVGNMFLPSSKPIKESLQIDESILLALYEAIHLNRNFITTLTHVSHVHSPTLTTPTSPTPAVEPALNPLPSPGKSPTLVSMNQPTNLLGTFLTFTSLVLQHSKGERSEVHSRLCLIILTCVVEDQFANAFLHDPNISFPVTLQRAPMLHRKFRKDRQPKSAPLACSVLELMVEYMISHLSKSLSVDLYSKCIGIVHRLLCYQKRCRVRLSYNWKELWGALLSLLKFIINNEKVLLPKINLFPLATQVAVVFNLFITYGDTFLPSPNVYDELYYELIRMHNVFDSLYLLAVRYTEEDGELKDSASRLISSLINIRAIVNHFTPKIDSWSASHQVASLTPDQVLEVVRNNYDTLTLKLQDNLDHYEKYSERPKESSFFIQLVRHIVTKFRDSISVTSLQQTSVLNELSSNTL
ncbi:armadillo-like helical domain-containing protein 3 [Dysidea avara]|uniref:armadillo-like helical domain-containing protein 3 n=1 Tax=Dysidea avara TaxID=196820 RepID=UPI003324F55A